MTVVEIYKLKPEAKFKLPLLLSRLPAGFPSPADDYIEERIDLNKKLIKHPEATYLIRVMGDSMEKARIYDGDYLIVDRAIEPENNDIVLAIFDGDFTVKRLIKKIDRWFLVAENPKYPPFEITPEMDFEIWGKVTYIFHPAV